MPDVHAAKIRIYTFLSDVAPEGQAKTPVPFFYRNNTEKYGCIVPHSVPNIVLDIVPIMCYTISVKMYVGGRYAKNDEYKRGGKPLEYQ